MTVRSKRRLRRWSAVMVLFTAVEMLDEFAYRQLGWAMVEAMCLAFWLRFWSIEKDAEQRARDRQAS